MNKKKTLKPFAVMMATTAAMAGAIGPGMVGFPAQIITAYAAESSTLNQTKSDIEWVVKNGTLYIDCNGRAMENYTTADEGNPAPWSATKSKQPYSSVTIINCQNIGDNAFVSDDNNAVAVQYKIFAAESINDSLGRPIKFGKNAFGRSKANNISVYGYISDIGENAFKDFNGDLIIANTTSIFTENKLKEAGVKTVRKELARTDDPSNEGRIHGFISYNLPESAKPKTLAEKVDSTLYGPTDKIEFLLSKGVEVLSISKDKGLLFPGYRADSLNVEFTRKDGIPYKEVIKFSESDAIEFRNIDTKHDFNGALNFTECNNVFTFDGGDYCKSAIQDAKVQNGKVALPEIKSSNPKYTFAGWRFVTNDNKKSKLITAGEHSISELLAAYSDNSSENNRDHTFIMAAEYVENGTFTITFKANSGSGKDFVEERSINKKDAKTLPYPSGGKAYYTPTSWNTKPDGSGKSFDFATPVDGTSFGEAAVKSGQNVVLYAQWEKPKSVEISFRWEDDSDRDGLRLKEIPIKTTLTSGARGVNNPDEVKEAKYKTDKSIKIVYPSKEWEWKTDSSKEVAIPGKLYDASMSIELGKISSELLEEYDIRLEKKGSDSYEIIATHEAATQDMTGKIKWHDNDDGDGLRPGSLDLVIKDAEDKITRKTVTVYSKDDETQFTLTGLKKYYGKGLKNSLTIATPSASGYTFTVSGTNIEAHHEKVTENYRVKTVWEDDNDVDGRRPDTYVVKLTGGGKTYTQSVSRGTATFKDIPTYKNGTEISYTATCDAVTKYTSSVSVDKKSHLITVTMRHKSTGDTKKKDSSSSYKSSSSSKNSSGNGSSSSSSHSNSKNSSRDNYSNNSTDEISMQDLSDHNKQAAAKEKNNSSSSGKSGNNSSSKGSSGGTNSSHSSSRSSGSEHKDNGQNSSKSKIVKYNNLDPEDYKNVTVSLIWDEHQDGKEMIARNNPKTVAATLKGSDGSVYEFTLEHISNYSHIISHVPFVDENNDEITYKLVPETVQGYVSHVYQDIKDKSKFTIENRRQTSDTADATNESGTNEGTKASEVTGTNKSTNTKTDSGKRTLPKEINDLFNDDNTETGIQKNAIIALIGGILAGIAAFIAVMHNKR